MATSQATQGFVPIKEVRDGVVILKDGSMRAILMASSLNFALKSKDEQDAIIFQFQNFLNVLDFSVQIVIQSRKLDINPYLALLQEREKSQISDLMKIQVKEYIEFIKTFTEENQIMTKTFFIVVPYTPPAISAEKIGGVADSFLNKKKVSVAKKDTFEEDRVQLEQRVAVVEQSIIRTGIRVARLGTEEAVEVFYKMFNPGDVEKPIHLA